MAKARIKTSCVFVYKLVLCPCGPDYFTEKEAMDLADGINKAVQEKQHGKIKPWTHGPYDRLDN
jgi:hypothetical protein